MRYFLPVLLLIAVPSLCCAEIYRWTDEHGQIGYSDDLGKVPPKFRDNAEISEKQESAVEIIEKGDPDKPARKDDKAKGDGKGDAKGDATTAGGDKSKEKKLFDGKDGPAWKQDFAKAKSEIKSFEEQAATIRDRMANPSKMSRGEYVTLQNTQRNLEANIDRAKKKLQSLIESADKAGLPGDFR